MLSLGQAQAARLLLDVGAAPDAVDGAGSAPSHLAAAEGHAAVLGALAGAGAAVSAPNARGSTPLHLAAGQGGAEAVAAFRGEHQLHLFVSEAKAAALQARLAAE